MVDSLLTFEVAAMLVARWKKASSNPGDDSFSYDFRMSLNSIRESDSTEYSFSNL